MADFTIIGGDGNSNQGPWNSLQGQISQQGEQIKLMHQLVYAIMLVVVLMTAALIVMVLGLFMDTWRDKTAVEREFQRELRAQRILQLSPIFDQ